MRVIVMFDLPTETADDRTAYRQFRKSLLREGFIMMQESVYCKLVMSPLAADLARDRLNKIKPSKGIIQLLTITEKQYAQMEYLIGGPQAIKEDSTERLVFF